MDSPMNSAVAFSPASTVSVLGSVVDVSPTSFVDKGMGSSSRLIDQRNSDVGVQCTIPKHNGRPLFDSGDGDIKLWLDGACFETHRYLLKRFNRLKDLLVKQPLCTSLRLSPNGYNADDFYRALEVLYASILEGPFEFDSQTLVSALRIATVHDYPALLAYAIQHLEQIDLTAIERIKIAREFGLASWEEPAYLELCERDEAITMEKANALGMDAFVRVAGIREREQRRRGKEVDGAATGPGDACFNAAESGNTAKSSHIERSASQPEGRVSDETLNIEMKPSFIDTPLGHSYPPDEWCVPKGETIRISGCNCCALNREGLPHNCNPCAIAPCAAIALKNLQIQQLAHANSIASLNTVINKIPLASKSDPIPSSIIPGVTCDSTREEVRLMVQALRGVSTAS